MIQRFEKARKWLLIILFFAFLFTMLFYLTVSADIEVSKVEKRDLAQNPDLSIENVSSGEYMDQFEEYFLDQFPGRNVWLKSYLQYQQMTNKTYIFDFYVSDSNWIIPKPSYSRPSDKIKSAVHDLNKFASDMREEGKEVYYASLPHKVNTVDILPSYIKEGTGIQNKEYFLSEFDHEKIPLVDVGKEFKEEYTNDELKDFYFKTDHHWNIIGAYKGYKKVTELLAAKSDYYTEANENESDYELNCENDKQFIGSYNNQLYLTVDASDEETCHMLPTDQTFDNYKITWNGKDRTFKQVYGTGIFRDKNPIEFGDLYMNNTAEVTIENPAVEKESRVLILKDSYANPIAFHVAQHFSNTTVYDIRYNDDQTLTEYMKDKDFDVVLFLYNDTMLQGEPFRFS
ncbi:DHHW family protein [Pseudalkalibacillus hwajinpoensis]|uniref:DHHW family protein n=1 Tax=Guptibacillus hwajinpoensis TaxID=208199 RepID=UPI00325C01E0